MSTEVQNLYFPVPRHEANTLASLNMEQSYEAGTINLVPTMTPMPPGEAGRRLKSSKAEETLEELDESLEYIKCVGRCKRRMDVLTHAQRLRLNAVSRGAHGDALYGRTPRGGGSLHDGLLVQRARERSARQESFRALEHAALRREGYDIALSEQTARRTESSQRAQRTRRQREAMRKELVAEGYHEANTMALKEIPAYYAYIRNRENIARREDMKSLSTDPNAERPEQSFAHRDTGGTYRPPDKPLGEEEAVEDIDRIKMEEDRDLVIPGEEEEHRGRAPAHYEGLPGGMTKPEGTGFLPP
jgi:hypothetical protein